MFIFRLRTPATMGGSSASADEPTSTTPPLSRYVRSSMESSSTSLLLFLDRLCYYQNRQTGQASQNPISLRQLCRILGPPLVARPAAVIPATTTTVLTPDSYIWLDPASTSIQDNNDDPLLQSSPEWQLARDLPIVRQVLAADWFYQDPQPLPAPEGYPLLEETNQQQVFGPYSCRALAHVIQSCLTTRTTTMNLTNHQDLVLSSLQQHQPLPRVYSATAQPAWQTIDQCTELLLAWQALDIVPTALLPQTLAPADDPTTPGTEILPEQVQDELQAFLQGTTDTTKLKNDDDEDDDDDDERQPDNQAEEYESDGGTRYIKDAITGKWWHEALVREAQQQKQQQQHPTHHKRRPPPTSQDPSQPEERSEDPQAPLAESKRKRHKKAKFAAKHAKCWIYVTGLPSDVTVAQVAEYFGKAGIIDLDPRTQRPKIKMYQYPPGHAQAGSGKGDASICYARPESVELALTLLDETPFPQPLSPGPNHGRGGGESKEPQLLKVERAKFALHGDTWEETESSRKRISNAQRKVAKLAAIQATDWDEGGFNGRLTGGRKGLRIITLKHVFDPALLLPMPSNQQEDDNGENDSSGDGGGDDDRSNRALQDLEQKLRRECEEFGEVEKMTVFSQHPDGVVLVKFALPGAASQAVKALDGRPMNVAGGWQRPLATNRPCIQASFWDGVTDYTRRDEVKEQQESERRQAEFGDWLENQEVPEEFRLKTDAD